MLSQTALISILINGPLQLTNEDVKFVAENRKKHSQVTARTLKLVDFEK